MSPKPYSIIYKKLGETPLEALERFRIDMAAGASRVDLEGRPRDSDAWSKIPMTYAGRLDPMAEGELLILIGDECKRKEVYLGLDKEYEVEVLFGVTTDTRDILGISDIPEVALPGDQYGSATSVPLSKYIGKFTQPYPAYSSKTVNGKQLHALSRAGELPDEMPAKEVEIYSISGSGTSAIRATELLPRILSSIDLVKGDFRQEEIKSRWKELLADTKNSKKSFEVMKITVKCSSGTYMRSLAERLGKDRGSGAIGLSIKRTRIF